MIDMSIILQLQEIRQNRFGWVLSPECRKNLLDLGLIRWEGPLADYVLTAAGETALARDNAAQAAVDLDEARDGMGWLDADEFQSRMAYMAVRLA